VLRRYRGAVDSLGGGRVTISDVSRFAAPGSPAARRLLVTLLAVAALLGILMMHSVALSHEGARTGAHEPASHTLSDDAPAIGGTPAEDHGPALGSMGCNEACEDTHAAGVMMCMLALLTAGFFLVGYAPMQWRMPPHVLLRRLLPRTGLLSIRLTSTHAALSISRT
jgi:hypothetical protein